MNKISLPESHIGIIWSSLFSHSDTYVKHWRDVS